MEDPPGLTLLGARYYDPMLGAFISVDPEIDEYDPQRLHAYAYANNNPVTFADPDGLFFGKLANAASKAVGSVASAAKATASFVVENAGTISAVAGGIAMVAAVLPPPAQVVAVAAGAVAAVAGAIDTAKTCAGGDAMGCAMGIAEMVPGVRQAKNAVRGAGAIKAAVKGKGSRSGCNSFLPGTLVLMADGTHKAIEGIDVGDVVWATDPETGKEGPRPVTTLISGNGDKVLVKITVDSDGDGTADGSVTATDEHPFWLDNRREWLGAEHLKPGDQLVTPDGARVTVMAVLAYGAVATVHNLTVDNIHTYYILAGAADVLVHNEGEQGDSCPLDIASEIGTQVAYGEDELSEAVRQARIADGKKTGRAGNYAAARLSDGSIITGRSTTKHGPHAEEIVLQRAGGRRIEHLYTERAPCKSKCQPQVKNIPSVTWSFRHNHPNPAIAKALRKYSTDTIRRITSGYFE